MSFYQPGSQPPQPSPAAYPGLQPVYTDAPLAMGDLRARPRYRARGVANWMIIPWIPAMMAVMALLAGFTRLVSSVAPTRDALMTEMWNAVGPLAMIAVGLAVTLYPIAKAQVHRWSVILLLDFLWVGTFFAAFHYKDLGWLLSGLGNGDVIAVLTLAWYLLKVCFFTITGMLINGSDGFRVHFSDERGGRWAVRREAFFKGTCGKKVLDALQRGDATTLAALRADAPTGAHGYHTYTTLHLSEDPVNPDAPSYLFIKDVFFGGGILYAQKVHAALGWSHLRHVELDAELKRRLLGLLPALQGKGAAADLSERKQGTVLGLPPGVKGPVYTKETGTWIGFVFPDEVRPFRAQATKYTRLGYILFVVAIAAVFLGLGCMALDGDTKEMGTWGMIGAGCVLTMFASMIASLVFLQRGPGFARNAVVAGLSSRAHKLFDPAKVAYLLVSIEEARTYDRLKIFMDDYGLIHVTQGWLMLEAGDTRARVSAADLKLETVSTSGGASLKISATVDGVPWALTVKDAAKQAQASGLFGKSPKKLAEELWADIYNGITGQAPAAPAKKKWGMFQ